MGAMHTGSIPYVSHINMFSKGTNVLQISDFLVTLFSKNPGSAIVQVHGTLSFKNFPILILPLPIIYITSVNQVLSYLTVYIWLLLLKSVIF